VDVGGGDVAWFMSRADTDWIGALPEYVRAKVSAASERRTLPAGTLIYERDAAPDGVFRLISGRAKAYFLAKDGREAILKICTPTEVIGDIASIDGAPRAVFAETLTACRFDFLPIARFNEIRAMHREVDAALVRSTTLHLRDALQLIEELMSFGLQARVAMRLHWIANQHCTGRQEKIELDIAQSDLALMVGVSRQTINRVLGELEAFGAIKTKYGSITVNSLKKLQDFAAHASKSAPN